MNTGDYYEVREFFWADSELIYEYESNSNYFPSLYYGTVYNYGLDLVSHYTTGEDSNSEYYYISDAHGDVKQLIDTSTLSAVSTNTYDAFGNGGAIEHSSFGYTGEYHDSETGFIYLRARYYDPTIGRFASEDPHWNLDNMIYGDPEESETLELAPKAPSYIAIAQSSNLYPYCANNPVSFVDSDGESIIVIAAALTVAVGGLLLGGCADPDDSLYNRGKNFPQNFLVFGSESKPFEKLNNQMQERGWSQDLVWNVVSNPYTTRDSINRATGNSATAYYDKQGNYVVVDDISNEVVQISDRNDPNWAPDRDIVDPYMPNDD